MGHNNGKRHRRNLSGNSNSSNPDRRKKKRKTKSSQIHDSDEYAMDVDSEDEGQEPQPPKAPTLGKAGRQPHSLRSKRRTTPPIAPTSSYHVIPTTPPPPKAKSNKNEAALEYTPRKSRIVQFSLQAPAWQMVDSSPELGGRRAKLNPKKSKREETERPLNKIKHKASHGWENLGECDTTQLFKEFELWKNDYSPHKYDIADSLVNIQYFGHPCDRPKDIRARPFVLEWITDNRKAPKKFKGKPVPVYRATYHCLGNCEYGESVNNKRVDGTDSSDPSDSETSESSDLDKNAADDGGIDKKLNSASVPKRRPLSKKVKCPNSVKIHVEVFSDNLSKAIVYQQNQHRPTRSCYLDMSPFIRQNILELATIADMTSSRIKRRLLKLYEEYETPQHRCPTSEQVNNIVQNVRRKERLLSDPLRAIGVFAEENPEKIFYYSPPDYSTDPPSNFATGIKHPFALQSILLWSSTHGVGLDSSYRHKNENRAPLTFLTTIDENHRMLPGPVFLSGDVTAETLEIFLREVKGLIEDLASGLIKGEIQVESGLESYEEDLLAQARIAILRWDKDNGNESFEPQKRPRLNLSRKHKLLHAVRAVQRCRFLERWDQYMAEFRSQVEDICDGAPVAARDIILYFEANWFCPEWRDLWTDIGLPTGQTRDAMLSTNNWTERAFKTFDQVFLGSRANKSAYRLVLIIANEWFQYYQEWRSTSKRIDKEAFVRAQLAHKVWSSANGIEEVRYGDGRRAWHVANIPT
ncbi:hypothetical protein BDZ97DRAFT_1915276 [Flammula alnicola]|nr:hypothetical protein BDZ97DRAFT_1915276 [Flammula alnicola]